MNSQKIKISFDEKNNLLMEQVDLYHNQYIKAIFKLLSYKKYNEYILPIINLIHQSIEKFLKYLILRYDWENRTATEVGIDNEHDLKKLIDNKLLCKEELMKIKFFNENYLLLKKEVLYFSNILGQKNTFINSRYAILKNKSAVSISNVEIDKLAFEKSFVNLLLYLSNVITVFTADNVCRVIKFENFKKGTTYEEEMNKFLEKYSQDDKDLIKALLIEMRNC